MLPQYVVIAADLDVDRCALMTRICSQNNGVCCFLPSPVGPSGLWTARTGTITGNLMYVVSMTFMYHVHDITDKLVWYVKLWVFSWSSREKPPENKTPEVNKKYY